MNDKVIRFQADRLNGVLGMELGDFIPQCYIELILNTPVGSTINVNNRDVVVTMSMKGLCSILLNKIKK